MSSTRSIALLLSVLAIAGCKKKSTASGGEPAGSAAPADSASAAPADSASAAPSSSAAGGDDGAAPTPAPGGDDGSAMPSDEGGAPTPTGRGGGFAGSYNCLGGLSLSQTGNGVKGSAITRAGLTSTTVEIDCTARGNECVGNASRFVSKEGKPPKNTGRQKITFRIANGGLEFNEGGTAGFCTRR